MHSTAYSLRRRRRFNRSPFKGDVKKVMAFGGKTLPSLPLYVLLGSANLNSIDLLDLEKYFITFKTNAFIENPVNIGSLNTASWTAYL